ncbi:MAG: hypothetical protein ACJ768_14455 [Gaiellaceae bacterium]
MRTRWVRALAALFAVSWFVLPGFGLIDLSVTWSSDWPQALEAGWGLFSTLIVGAAFVLLALRPRALVAATLQLAVGTASLVVAAAVAREPGLLWLAAVMGFQSAIVIGLSQRRRGGPPNGQPVSRPLLFVAATGTVPWLAYALRMWDLNRANRPIDVSLGVDHYSMQGALAVVLVLLSVTAALRPAISAFAPVCAGVAAFYLGLVCVAWSDTAGGLSTRWSIAAMAWGATLVVLALSGQAASTRLPHSSDTTA